MKAKNLSCHISRATHMPKYGSKAHLFRVHFPWNQWRCTWWTEEQEQTWEQPLCPGHHWRCTLWSAPAHSCCSFRAEQGWSSVCHRAASQLGLSLGLGWPVCCRGWPRMCLLCCPWHQRPSRFHHSCWVQPCARLSFCLSCIGRSLTPCSKNPQLT